MPAASIAAVVPADFREADLGSTATDPIPVEDQRLLGRFLSGEPAACRTIERWAWEVVLFGRFGLLAHEREDVVEDTVAAVWRDASRPGFALRRGLKAFVRRVATSRAIDRLRRRRPSAPLDAAIPDPRPDPYEDLLRRDESARVRWALQHLDPPCQEIIRLHLYEDLPYAEIAAREQRSEATMRVRMFNCLKAIRKLLARWA